LASFKRFTHDAMQASDLYASKVKNMFQATHGAVISDQSTALALLKQYFVSASRYERRLTRSGLLQDELVFRIFRQLDVVQRLHHHHPAPVIDEATALACLHYAFRAMAVFFRLSEARMILDMKTTWFPHVALSTSEYDDLILLCCTNAQSRSHEPMQVQPHD
jgi:hypothetical protein